MSILFIKITLLLALALACVSLARRSSAAMRHLICACALGGALLLPFTLLAPPEAAPIRVSAITIFTASSTATTSSAWPVSSLLAGIWVVGTALLLLRLAIGYAQVARIVRRAVPWGTYLLADVSVPVVTGLIRPAILFPRAAASWPASQRDAALQHESAHIERRDLWTNLIAHIACAVYWFHPLAWAVARRMRQEQETACDDAVLHAGIEPASYAEALVATACNLTSTHLIGCHMLTKETLKSRIARLLENRLPRMSSPATLRRTAILFAAAAVVVAMLNGNPPARAVAAVPEQKPAAVIVPLHAIPAPQASEAAQKKAPVLLAQNSAQGPGASGDVFRVGNGVSAPRVLYRVDPDYTVEAKDAKIEGAVLLAVVIYADGTARDITVLKGIDAGLDENAVEAIGKWTFQPGMKDGQPVNVRAQIEVMFRLL